MQCLFLQQARKVSKIFEGIQVVSDFGSKEMNHSALYGFSVCFLFLNLYSVSESKNEFLVWKLFPE